MTHPRFTIGIIALLFTAMTLSSNGRFLQANGGGGQGGNGGGQGGQGGKPPGNGTNGGPQGGNMTGGQGPMNGQKPEFNVNYSSSLGCGLCILGNYTFCVQAVEGTVVTDKEPTSYCCKDSTCSQASDTKNWNCSSSYSNKQYAQQICPFNKKACGNNNTINMKNTTDKQKVNITGLAIGQTCFFTVSSQCGAPSVEFGNATNVAIQFMQYQSTKMGMGGNSNSGQGNSGNQGTSSSGPTQGGSSGNKGNQTGQGGSSPSNPGGQQGQGGQGQGGQGQGGQGQGGQGQGGQGGPGGPGMNGTGPGPNGTQGGPGGPGGPGMNGSGPGMNGTGPGMNGSFKGDRKPGNGMPPKNASFVEPMDGPVDNNQLSSSQGKSGFYDPSQGGKLVWGQSEQSNNSTVKGKKYSLSDSDCDDRVIMISVTGVSSNQTNAATSSTKRLRMLAEATGSATMQTSSQDFSTTETATDDLVETTNAEEDDSFAHGLKITSTFLALIVGSFMVMFQ